MCRRGDGEHGRPHARDADVPAAPPRRTDPDHRLVEVRREEALRLPAGPHVARGARGRDGVGRAPVLLAAIDRSPARALARGALVESPAELRLHARRFLKCGPVVGFGRARTRPAGALTPPSQAIMRWATPRATRAAVTPPDRADSPSCPSCRGGSRGSRLERRSLLLTHGSPRARLDDTRVTAIR